MRRYKKVNIAFLHVPKTGGRSLMRLLRRNYLPRSMMLYYPPKHVDVAPMSGHGNLFIGHYSMGKQHEVFADCELVTFLRDPADRLISHIFFMQRYYTQPHIPPDNVYKRWFQENTDVFDVLRFSRLWYLDNAMVRMISGVRDSVPVGELDGSALERAKANLQRFGFIGFQESFEDDLLRLCRQYQLKAVISRRNRGFNRYTPSEKDHELLASRSEFDAELYQFARAMTAREGIGAGTALKMKALGRARNIYLTPLEMLLREVRR
ncbi:sulfotransferase family 2 domain-containing protein [Dyella sp.]|uniref:sulfotransferase family 2 domain-containing protein n=1 Tax=Dyella sp. TaxID=1869338 RepID=UPI002D79F307|nr:sulfotransferase family 2 domain-containing protein [Dyella sp.]HET7330189.1 sulfotransferase family 2 domain-containing protein [Dyella sp.]